MSLTELPPLPYDYSALEPYIDAETMTIHHTKHHATYVNNVKGALEKFPELKDLGLVDLNKAVGTEKIPKEVATVIRNNGGGHYNHSFFWKVMGKPGDNNGPSADLKAAIDSSFGSLDEMKSKFNAAAAGRFGSGWAWLISKNGGGLEITSTANQDNPLQAIVEDKGIPILGLDVWEHAYYLKYRNLRPAYISAWWNVVNWEQVNANFEAAKKGAVPI
ncbi:superoxide dismutase [Mn], mitochondrial [Coccomyxa subellipsoidea C-169]|uniref:Superoxide dismutase n=1 Tax=Coccomyxa subellipsoidea (strain C-169) TaxID=574566 RepID=I0Z9N3_COCSC|nr:superoxide dismutase [Mn], mitochondrial [Coccomyxa subellipsoidea C-169]EIE27352.1 superoxide dismutase [Mn], mitochondrial [Coccomyxa subellipsoidea C-169]|eukprot:XP_005651896.1 superoxide dismutase [Mn], mitochondrial [Coccomyxa subellipsoidea C-169]